MRVDITSWFFVAICLQASLGQARNLRSSGVIGIIDGISNSAILGWACQEGNPQSIDIHVYVGGPAGQGTILKGFTANLSSERAVARACGTFGRNYRFEVPITAEEAMKHAEESIYIHGISSRGNRNNLLVRSGEFKIPQLTPTKVLTSTPRPSPGDIKSLHGAPSTPEFFLVLSKSPTTPPIPTESIPEEAIRINTGGSVNYTDTEGRLWIADTEGSTYSICPSDITGTTNAFLYCSERYHNGFRKQTPFRYDIPVPHPGRYLVQLHFAEVSQHCRGLRR